MFDTRRITLEGSLKELNNPQANTEGIKYIDQQIPVFH